jgi:hypothetical protein
VRGIFHGHKKTKSGGLKKSEVIFGEENIFDQKYVHEPIPKRVCRRTDVAVGRVWRQPARLMSFRCVAARPSFAIGSHICPFSGV